MKEKQNIISNQRRTDGLRDMQNILEPLTRKILGKKAFAEADVICHWKEIVGEETALYSHPLKIDFKKDKRTEGVLWIETGGAFALELQSKSKTLIDCINTFFGYEAVKSIKILQNPEILLSQKHIAYNFEKTLVSTQEEIYINNQSKGLHHKELERALCKLGIAIIENNKKSDA